VSWVYRSLAEAGFTYSSSEFRIRAKLFPQVSTSSLPFETAEGLIEVPVNPARYLGVTIPYNGGGWARFFPVSLLLAVLGAEAPQPHPKVFFLHPREIDPASRVLPLSPFHSFLHHHGIEDMPGKLDVPRVVSLAGNARILATMRPAPRPRQKIQENTDVDSSSSVALAYRALASVAAVVRNRPACGAGPRHVRGIRLHPPRAGWLGATSRPKSSPSTSRSR
jgi:hypothetical protein